MLTIVMAIYGQPLMLARQLQELRTYPESLRKQLSLIIVDDHGSPPVSLEEAALLQGLVQTKVYRVADSIPWNQMGARNLGMHKARGWCVMIDADMVIEAHHAKRMIQAIEKIQRGRVIKFGLRHVSHPDRGIDMSSPNTFIIHSDDFKLCGGYDEDYAGNKGWSDVQLQDIYIKFFKVQKRPDIQAMFFSNDEIIDAMVHTLDRNVSKNRKKRVRKRDEQKVCGGWMSWVRKHKGRNLRFNWIRVFPPI